MSSYELLWEDAVFGAICIAGGILLCFFGFRLFKPALFCTGTFLGYVIMYAILSNAGVENHVGMVLGSLAFGIVLGLFLIWMVLCVAKLVLFLLGFLAGFTLAIYIMSWSESILIESAAGRWAMIVVFAVVAGILAVLLKKFFIIVATAWYGAFFMVYGIDVFAQTGFSEGFENVIIGDPSNSDWKNAVYAMLVLNAVLFGVGTGVQICITGKDKEYEEEEKHDYSRI